MIRAMFSCRFRMGLAISFTALVKEKVTILCPQNVRSATVGFVGVACHVLYTALFI